MTGGARHGAVTPPRATSAAHAGAPDARGSPVVTRRAAALLGLAAGVALLGVWATAYGLRMAPFAPFDLADLVIRRAPGDLATRAIEQFGHRAQRLLQLACVAVALIPAALLGLALRRRPSRARGALLAAPALPPTLALEWWAADGFSVARGLWETLFFALTLCGAGALAGGWLARLAREARPAHAGHWLDAPGDYGRRALLRQALGATALVGVGGGLAGWVLRRAPVEDTDIGAGLPLEVVRAQLAATPTSAPLSLPTPRPAPPMADDFDAPAGVRPRQTSNANFYIVDISTRDPRIAAPGWSLRVHGLVERELTLTYADLLSMPAIELDATLRCISFTYGSDLISTTRWTGVPLRDVLRRAGLRDGIVDVVCRGTSGYSDSFPLAKALEPTTLLVYGMNGEALPRAHGYPCRVYVANLYGEKNVKWLREIELVNDDYTGYWQERGWTDVGIINILSIIDTPDGRGTVRRDDQGRVPIGGVAFAGARGVAAVQVRIDDGPWQDASVEPYTPALVWQRWRLDWRPEPGAHNLTVRAVDLTGAEQIALPHDPHPDGITGLQTVTVRVA